VKRKQGEMTRAEQSRAREGKKAPRWINILRESTIPGLMKAGIGMLHPRRMVLSKKTGMLPCAHSLNSGNAMLQEWTVVTPLVNNPYLDFEFSPQ
jgi:hypothetical protein